MYSVEFSLFGIVRRMDYCDFCKIEYKNHEYQITNGNTSFYNSKEYNDVVSMMAGSMYIQKELQNDIYQVIAKYIFSTHCDMIYGFHHYGPYKSNWDACLVKSPKFLRNGKCFLYNKTSIKILKNKDEAQKYTYYELPYWWNKFLMI